MQKPNAVLDYLGSPCRGLDTHLIHNLTKTTYFGCQYTFFGYIYVVHLVVCSVTLAQFKLLPL